MKDTSPFKIAILIVFILSTVLGLALFAMSKGPSDVNNANLVAWGTISIDAFDALYNNSTLSKDKTIKINYVRKDVTSFDSEFVEALAEGTGPDMVILRDDLLNKEINKLILIPYKSYSERTFKDKFIEAGEVFLYPNGILALPIMVDPMVLYWNRDTFSSSQISQPPKYWDEINSLIEKMTKKDSDGNILRSAIALGEWRNINSAKEIISTLLLQAGTPIVARDSQGNLVSVIDSSLGYSIPPGRSTLDFYTQFSNPSSANYTWNRSLPSSLNFFLSGNLSMYMGFASEIFSIQQKNSNLNFDVTYLPQIRESTKKTVFGRIYAMAIVKQSKNITSTFIAMNALTEPAPLKSLETVTNLPPVRRDLLADKPTDAFRSVFYNSALITHSWFDPNYSLTTNTFRDMIESITGGRMDVIDALSRANSEINNQLK